MKLKIYLFLLCFGSVFSLAAQKRIKISGKIIDSDNQPVELANIRVANSLTGTVSDLKGNYELLVAPADSLSVIYSCLGYKKAIKTFYHLSQDVKADIRLYSTTKNLDNVTVTAHRKQTSTLQTLNAGDARLMPDASGGSIEGLLTTFAGVNSSNELSSQYSVRGGNFDENIVYVNGIEVYRPLLVRSGQQEGLSFINPDMVGEVGFSTGGYSAEYGDKMSSVLDITYKRPQTFEGSVSASFLGASVAVGQSTGKFSQLHGFRYKTNSTLLSSLDTKGEYDPSFFDYQTYITYKFNERWKASLLGNISVNKYNFIPKERNTSFGTSSKPIQFKVYFDGQEKDKFDTYFGALTLDYSLSKNTGISLLTSAFMTDEEVTYDISGQYWLDELDASDETGKSDAESAGTLGIGTYHEHARNKLRAKVFALALKGETKWKQNEIKWGANYQREIINDRVKEWEMRDSAGYSKPHTGEGIDLIYNLYSRQDIESNRYSFYLQDTYRLRSKAGLFTFTAGVRGSYWDFNREFIFSPRASVGFIPQSNSQLTFRLASGLYYQAPFYKEFRDTVRDERNAMVVQLNRDIRSQRSWQVVLGGDYSFRALDRPFKFTAELYYKKLSNLVPYEVDNVRIWYYGKNLSKGYTAGLDMKFFGEFVPGTDSWVSFSLMSAKETIHGVKVPRPTEQRYSISLFFQDFVPKFPKYKFHLKAIWSDGLPVAAPRTGRESGYFRTSPYRRVDIGVSRALITDEDKVMRRGFFRYFKSIWIGLDVFNLLGISNTNSYYWVTDVYENQYAVPNYLTMRQFNIRLSATF